MIGSVIYSGKVRHRRFIHTWHEFSYRLFMFCFDIAAIDVEFKNIPQVSVEKFNWFSFRRKNYLANSEIQLDQAARELVKEKQGIYPTGKIYLLTHLSCLGYCFNPISLYFVFKNDSQELDFLIVEVTNTPWGEKHSYVLANPAKPHQNIYKYNIKKELHVSPFLAMDYEYQFSLKVDNQKIILHIENYRQQKLHFDATLSLSPVPLNTISATKVFLNFPLITHKVSASIYWQAFKLWVKGVPFHAHLSRRKNSDHGQ